jgi:hypothetical protein
LEGKSPMRTLAPNSPAVQSEIDSLFEALSANLTLWMPSLDPLAGVDLAGPLKDVKPWPQTSRRRGFNQRDITKALRAAKAAGVEVREIMPDGRIILGSPDRQFPSGNGMAKDAADVVAERLG